MHATSFLNALRKKFIARQGNDKRLDGDKNDPRPADETDSEEAIEEKLSVGGGRDRP